MSFFFDYWRPQATVDIVVLRHEEARTSVLLIQRGNKPFKGYWALPGGFIDSDDDNLSAAALRELSEETGLTDVAIVQVGAWGSKGRDPRDWTVTVVFGACLYAGDGRLDAIAAGDDAKRLGWFDVTDLPPLAFDHSKVIPCSVKTILHDRHGIGDCTP